jgi:hypothetical protein
MAVMGGDDIVVGSNPSIRATSPAQASGRPLDRQERRRPALCGAMLQQRDDSGAQSMPQQLVQLVGCRDLKVRPSLKR